MIWLYENRKKANACEDVHGMAGEARRNTVEQATEVGEVMQGEESGQIIRSQVL